VVIAGAEAEREKHRRKGLPPMLLQVGAISTSMSLQRMGRQHASPFVGQWAPTFLIPGLCTAR
jgi:hypothetical protein